MLRKMNINDWNPKTKEKLIIPIVGYKRLK